MVISVSLWWKWFSKSGWMVRAKSYAARNKSNYREHNSTLNKIKLEEKEIGLRLE
jgi:hypothetical protein